MIKSDIATNGASDRKPINISIASLEIEFGILVFWDSLHT